MNLSTDMNAMHHTPLERTGANGGLLGDVYEPMRQIGIRPRDYVPAFHNASFGDRLQPRSLNPGKGPARAPTGRCGSLNDAASRDELPGKGLTEEFLERMLADPMTRLIMTADGVSEAEVRTLYQISDPAAPQGCSQTHVSKLHLREPGTASPGPQPGSARPGIGE